jgi:hypothetical protein
MRLVVIVLILVSCKADKERCDQAVRNYATLTYWLRANKEIAAAPAPKRVQLRKDKVARFTYEMESGVDVLVSQCQSANNDDQIDCMIAAKTAEQALACADLMEDEKVE